MTAFLIIGVAKAAIDKTDELFIFIFSKIMKRPVSSFYYSSMTRLLSAELRVSLMSQMASKVTISS